MRFIFVDSLRGYPSGTYTHYRHQKLGGGEWEYCDMRAYINKYQDIWLNDVEQWYTAVSEIVQKHTRWWWFLPASRLLSWYPPIFNDLFFAIALIEYSNSLEGEDFYVVGCPREVFFYFKELNPGYNYTIERDKAKSRVFSSKGLSFFANIKVFLLNSGLKIFLKYVRSMLTLMSLVPYSLGKGKNLSEGKTTETLIYSHILNAGDIREKGDHFFGRMFDDVSFRDKKDILWVYFSEKKEARKIVENYVKSQGYRMVFLFDFLKWDDVMRIILISGRFLRSMRFVDQLPPLKISRYQSRIFLKTFWREAVAGILPITEWAVYFAMKRLLQQLSVKTIIYPYEGKTLECAISSACDEVLKNICRIGFAHAVYTKGHLCLRNRKGKDGNPHRPDIILAPGQAIKDWLIDWAGMKSNDIKVVGSPRHHECLPLPRKIENDNYSRRILILTGMGYELVVLSNYVEEEKDLFDGCELVVRRYPFGWDHDQDEGIYRLKKCVKNLRVGTETLQEQLSWCGVAIYSSTSSGIEAMLSGRLAIYVALHDTLDLDPLVGKGDLSKIYRCMNPLQLKNVLQGIRNMDKDEYLTVIQTQREFARQIYSSVNREELHRIIMN